MTCSCHWVEMEAMADYFQIKFMNSFDEGNGQWYCQQAKRSKAIEVLPDQEQTQTDQKRTPSGFIQQYRQYMRTEGDTLFLSQDNMKRYRSQLENNGIFYRQNEYHQFSISYFPNSKDYEVLTATVDIGNSQFRVSILNMLGHCPFRTVGSLSNGNQSQIYIESFDEEQFAIKIVLIKQELSKHRIIQLAIKEYCILKFCSALECGPLTKGYLGFDLIAYDNCIIFAMQKVDTACNLSSKCEKELKQQLSVMHRFKLVHFDIKPQNVSYSPYFQRQVFIDFGLSQFLQEDLGYKTQCHFRGSMRFCGEEMLKLFISSLNSSQIDLYYNDVQSLQKTVLQANGNLDDRNKPADEQEYISKIVYQMVHPMSKRNDVQVSIFVILFKYHLSFRNHQTIIQLIRQPFSLRMQDYREMLKFIKKVTPLMSFRETYNKQFIRFAKAPQYKEILQYLTVDSGAFYYQKLNTGFDEDEEDENVQVLKSRFYSSDKQTGFNQKELQNIKKSQLQFLSTFQVNGLDEESKHAFFDHFLDCIRFDSSKYDFSLEQKHKMSEWFSIKFLGSEVAVKKTIVNIQNCLTYLLNYCLTESKTANWKDKSLFLIIQQAIYADIDLTPFLPRLQSLFHGEGLSVGQKITLIINIFRVINLLNYKHLSNSCRNIEAIFTFLEKQSLFLKQSCLHAEAAQQSQQMITLQILRYIWHPPDTETVDRICALGGVVRRLERVCDHQLADNLQKYMFYQQMNRSTNYNDMHPTLKIFDMFKATLTDKWIKEAGFQIQYYLAIGIKLMRQNLNTKEVIKAAQRIQRIINCEQVSCLFKFGMVQFLHKQSHSKELLQRYIKEMKKAEETRSFSCLIFEYFLTVEIIFKQSKTTYHIEKSSIELFNSLKATYFEECDRLQDIHKWRERQFDSIRLDVIMLAFKKQSSQATLAYLEWTILKPHSVIEKFQCETCRRKLRLMEAVCRASCFMVFQERKEAFSQCEVCLEFSESFGYSDLAYYFLGNLVTISIHFSIFKGRFYSQMQAYRYHNMFYCVNLENNLMLNYFRMRGCYLIYFALQAFHRQGMQGQTMQFLVELAKVVTIYPCSDYVGEWCNNLVDFHYDNPGVFNMADFSTFFPPLCWKNCYLICYYFFCLGSGDDRPILSRINRQLDNISYFTKGKLLGRYYGSFVALKKMRLRQKKWIEVRLLARYQEKVRVNSIKKVRQLRRKQLQQRRQSLHTRLLLEKLKKYLS